MAGIYWAPRYFAERYFAPRYFPGANSVTVATGTPDPDETVFALVAAVPDPSETVFVLQ